MYIPSGGGYPLMGLHFHGTKANMPKEGNSKFQNSHSGPSKADITQLCYTQMGSASRI